MRLGDCLKKVMQRIKSVSEFPWKMLRRSNVATSLKRRRKNILTPLQNTCHPSEAPLPENTPLQNTPLQNTPFAKVTLVPPFEGRRHLKLLWLPACNSCLLKHLCPVNLTNSLLLTAKGLECIHPSVNFPLIRTDTTLKVCISVWQADMKILVTPPTADEYLLNMLCVYAELCFTKFDASHFRQTPQGPWDPSNLCYWHLRIYSVAPLSSVPMTCALDHTAWTIQGSSLPRLWSTFW